MGMTIKKVGMWETSDGVKHSTKAMADQHIINTELIDSLTETDLCVNRNDAQDILNVLSARRKLVRAWLDACDAMEKESLR